LTIRVIYGVMCKVWIEMNEHHECSTTQWDFAQWFVKGEHWHVAFAT
jgi:hypothetical protein